MPIPVGGVRVTDRFVASLLMLSALACGCSNEPGGVSHPTPIPQDVVTDHNDQDHVDDADDVVSPDQDPNDAGESVTNSSERRLGPDEYEVEVPEYHPPEIPPEINEVFVDDVLGARPRPAFDPELVDRRPLKSSGRDWQVNSSEAVLRLDVPLIYPGSRDTLQKLHPSYAAALASAQRYGAVLPSVNLIDGKAKQFDDGLVAAINSAYYEGIGPTLPGQIDFVRRLYERAGPTSPAAPFLAAGLQVAGAEVTGHDAQRAAAYLAEFEADVPRSKPIGFYTWSSRLATCFRFVRFFQKQFADDELAVPLALSAALEGDAELRQEYLRILDRAARLTNPAMCRSLADLMSPELVAAREVPPRLTPSDEPAPIAVFPPSTSREYELIEAVFHDFLPPDANIMVELVRAVRSGDIDLSPDQNAGWYQHQAYALETFLLPSTGAEGDKLLLGAGYKRRMLEAFAMLVTTRRETHTRDLASADVATAEPPIDDEERPPPPPVVAPRLRVEPCPSYYLRTARAYRFLHQYLLAAIGSGALDQLYGLREGGPRDTPLGEELAQMQDLFYGLYLLSAEDLGLSIAATAEELPDADAAYARAEEWVANFSTDPDLAADVRISVPVNVDYKFGAATRIWLTVGVRLARLDASYAVGPRIRLSGSDEWLDSSHAILSSEDYLIAVGEFAEASLPGLQTLTREELREVCDREQSKERILAALQSH